MSTEAMEISANHSFGYIKNPSFVELGGILDARIKNLYADAKVVRGSVTNVLGAMVIRSRLDWGYYGIHSSGSKTPKQDLAEDLKMLGWSDLATRVYAGEFNF